MADTVDEKKAAEAYETQAYEALEKDFQAVSAVEHPARANAPARSFAARGPEPWEPPSHPTNPSHGRQRPACCRGNPPAFRRPSGLTEAAERLFFPIGGGWEA